MHTLSLKLKRLIPVLAVAGLLASLLVGSGGRPAQAQHMGPADGMICTSSPGATFTLTTQTGYIGTPDGNVVYMWGYSEGAMPFQHPSPVLCVNQGDTVTIVLHNTLPYDVSIVFPGQENVLADGAPAQPQFNGGVLTSLTDVAAANGGSVTYSFTATHPGTFIYQSGTDPDVQVRLGLFGVLVVRPTAGEFFAYNDASLTEPDSEFNHGYYDSSGMHVATGEYLVLQSEVDPILNQEVERAVAGDRPINFNMANYHPRYWLLNGRGLPDTIAPNFASWLPSQPYGALARITPNDEMNPMGEMNTLWYLERFANVSSQPLPFHPHGKNAIVIGRDGRPARGPGGEDLSYEKFSLPAGPGQTYDALFHYHYREGYDPNAIPPKPVPVPDPGWANLAYGMFYSGSPYLGMTGPFPPGMTSMASCGEYYIIAHNHALFQLTSWGVVMTGPGTFLRVDPPEGCAPMAMP